MLLWHLRFFPLCHHLNKKLKHQRGNFILNLNLDNEIATHITHFWNRNSKLYYPLFSLPLPPTPPPAPQSFVPSTYLNRHPVVFCLRRAAERQRCRRRRPNRRSGASRGRLYLPASRLRLDPRELKQWQLNVTKISHFFGGISRALWWW